MDLCTFKKTYIHPVYYLSAIGSTNNYLKDLTHKGAPEGTLVIAEQQHGGRGRKGRTWFSPPGSLYFSMLFKPVNIKITGFSPVVALAIVEGLTGFFPMEFKIKWPNDIYVAERKCGGILCEVFHGNLVVGVGVNLRYPGYLPDHLTDKAGFLQKEEDQQLDIFQLILTLTDRLRKHYNLFSQKGFIHFKERLEGLSFLKGRWVTIKEEGIAGQVVGYNDGGALLLKITGGVLKTIWGGTPELYK